VQTSSKQPALEWEGGSLDELVAMLSEPALAVRVEVRTPSAGRPRKVGEVHIVAGGVSETIAGELRGDDALEHLRTISPLSFRVQPRLPNPDDGGLLIPGSGEGTLADRPAAELMRYCELYVLTCVIELWRDTDRAEVHYNRGEIVSTLVNGSEADDKLPEVMNWSSGGYQIVLPELSLPASSAPAGVTAASAPSPAPASRAPAGNKTLFGYASPEAIQAMQPVVAAAPAAQPEPQPSAPSAAEPTQGTVQGLPTQAPVTSAPATSGQTASAEETSRSRKKSGKLQGGPKPKKKSVKRREARESRKTTTVPEPIDEQSTSPVADKTRKGELSVGMHVAIGLGLGLALAALFALYQMLAD